MQNVKMPKAKIKTPCGKSRALPRRAGARGVSPRSAVRARGALELSLLWSNFMLILEPLAWLRKIAENGAECKQEKIN